MDKNIRFDHSYTNDQSHRFLKKLISLGFKKGDYDVEHPGKHFCSFIEFKNPNGNNTYLEFIHTGRGGVRMSCPGLSFGYEKNLESYFKTIKKSVYQPHFSHKNYDWKNNSKDRLPGWNFVTFKKLGFRTIEPWFTEYEPPRKNRNWNNDHKNGANTLLGGKLVLNPKGIEFMQSILKLQIKDGFQLSDGTYWEVKKGSSNKMLQINLGAKNLDSFPSKYLSRNKTVLISNPNGKAYWDICIYEN